MSILNSSRPPSSGASPAPPAATVSSSTGAVPQPPSYTAATGQPHIPSSLCSLVFMFFWVYLTSLSFPSLHSLLSHNKLTHAMITSYHVNLNTMTVSSLHNNTAYQYTLRSTHSSGETLCNHCLIYWLCMHTLYISCTRWYLAWKWSTRVPTVWHIHYGEIGVTSLCRKNVSRDWSFLRLRDFLFSFTWFSSS